MTPEIEHVLDEVRGAWRFRWLALAAAFAIAVAGWAIVFSLPDRYGAEARVFVDTRTALKPALQGLTIDQNVDAQINFVRQSLLEGPQLETIAKQTGVLPPSITDERARAQVLDNFSNRVTLTVATAGNQGDERSTAGTIYEFHYEDLSRARALSVVDTLLNTFVEQTLGGKREGSENAQKFLETQIKDYEQRLSVAEDKLATFKKQNLGLMPNDQGGYFADLGKETDAAKKAETDLSIAVSRREELTKQLHSDQAVSAAGTTGPGGGGNAVGGRYLKPHPAGPGEARRAAVEIYRSTSRRDRRSRRLSRSSKRGGRLNWRACAAATHRPWRRAVQEAIPSTRACSSN